MVDSLTLSSIFFLGCIHAFEPGHGKSFLMAYTVSGKLNLKKSFLLSISLIISHLFILTIISIYVFGIAIILLFITILFNFASHFFKSKIDGLSKNLDAEMLSGILIIGVSIIYFSYNIFGGSH